MGEHRLEQQREVRSPLCSSIKIGDSVRVVGDQIQERIGAFDDRSIADAIPQETAQVRRPRADTGADEHQTVMMDGTHGPRMAASSEVSTHAPLSGHDTHGFACSCPLGDTYV